MGTRRVKHLPHTFHAERAVPFSCSELAKLCIETSFETHLACREGCCPAAHGPRGCVGDIGIRVALFPPGRSSVNA